MSTSPAVTEALLGIAAAMREAGLIDTNIFVRFAEALPVLAGSSA